VAECFHRVPVEAGDAMFLPSGRVHAIGSGLVIFEIQQNSDTTFRVFDWNRKDSSGKARPLQVAESLQCIDFADFEPQVVHSRGPRQTLADDPLFRVEMLEVDPAKSLTLTLKSALVLAVIEGNISIGNNLSLAAGQFCLLPASISHVPVQSRKPAKVLLAETR